MNSKFVKTWFIVAGSFAGLGALYYIIRIVDSIVNDNSIKGTLLYRLNTYALICLGVALVMLIAIIPLAKWFEKKEDAKASRKQEEPTLLAKYKTKKTK